MKKYKFLLILTIILTLLYSLYYWGIPSIVNSPENFNLIEKTIFQKTGYKIKTQNPHIKMGIIPAIWFTADDISLLNDDSTYAVQVSKPTAKINLFPLITGKIKLGHFSSDYLNVNLVYTKDEQLKVGQYNILKTTDTKMVLSKACLHIKKYKISLKDYKQNKTILLDGNTFNLDEFKKNKRLKLSTNAKLFVNKKSSDMMADIDIKLPINKITEDQFKIKGYLTNVDLSDFSDYMKLFPQTNIKSLGGKINLTADTTDKNHHKNISAKISIDNLAIMQEELARSIYCKNNIIITLDANTIKNGINIKNLDIKTKDLNVNVNGDVTKLNAKMPHLNTNVEIKNSRTESFIPLMPGLEDLSEDVNSYALKKYWFYGDIQGKFKLKGKADMPDVFGNILVTNGYVVSPIRNNTPKATIKINFNEDLLNMDIKVPAPNNQAVFVKGWTKLYGKRIADLMITSTENVDLKVTQNVLNPLHEILKFLIGPVPIMDIHGIGNINLHVTGTKKEPHGWGYFNFKNTTASFLDVNNMTITSANGTLTFDDLDTHFVTKTAFLYGKPIIIDGKCNVYGVLDFDVTTKEQNLGNLLKIVQTSPMLKEIQSLLKPIQSAKGKSDFVLKLTGEIPDIHNIVFNKNLFAKGNLKLYSASATMENIPVSNITGEINFNNLNVKLGLTSNLDSSEIKINGDLNDKTANLTVLSNKFILKDTTKILNKKLPNDIAKIHTSFIANYNGNINKIEPNKLNVKGKVYASKGQFLNIENFSFDINNSQLKTSAIKGYFKSSPYNVNLHIKNLLTSTQSVNGNFDIKNFNLAYLNGRVKDLKDLSGIINIKGNIKDNGIYTDINLNNISFVYKPENLKIRFSNGKASIRKDVIYLNKVTSFFGEMPVFANGKISNIFKTPMLNLYVNTKPNQGFVDQVFNNKAVYPLKLKGDINLSSELSGSLKDLHNKTKLRLAENASIYYMGATLGNSNNDSYSVEINTDNIIYPSNIKINSFKYDKLIKSQNNKFYNQTQLNSSGTVYFLPNNEVKFYNFKIKTQQPTDAKIFNIIFRKPFMKQGIFTSDLILNGTTSSPELLGKLHITSIALPVLDATINDIDLNFKKDKISLNSLGTILSNKLKIYAVMNNSLKSPLIFDNITVKIEKLNLNKITSALQDYDVFTAKNKPVSDTTKLPINLNNIIIKNSKIIADNIQIKNLEASDFVSNISLNEKMQLNIENYKFNIANGTILGNGQYNMLNNVAKFSMKVDNANVNTLSENLLGLKGQIYGSVISDIDLSCNIKTQNLCTQTLKGNIHFVVANGRMPKLGSLEYLLKAGNLIKSGVTGLSIKGIIDLITPYKTGNFNQIKGDIHITDGRANNIQIYSSGKDLNMYMKGTYNIINSIADMQIYGGLTKNFKTLFGKIGNASLNTLFNTIPGINVSDAPSVITEDIKKIPNIYNNTRIFHAEISGDINGNNYVKSFNWLK